MRALLYAVVLLLIGGVAWGVGNLSSHDFGDDNLQGVATLAMQKKYGSAVMSSADRKAEDERQSVCFRWGGFSVSDLTRVRLHLKRQQLMDEFLIQDRFGPERYIAYLGPYDNKTAVRAFVKQFRQQGITAVRPILSGELSYGVEIASFKTRDAAETFLTSNKAPKVKGIKITNRLGEPTGVVDLIFPHIDARENERLERLRALYPRTTLTRCEN